MYRRCIWFELSVVVVDSQCREVENENRLTNDREEMVVTG